MVPGTIRSLHSQIFAGAVGSYIRKIIVGIYTYSDAPYPCIYLAISKRNLCSCAQISTDLNISNGIMSFKNSSYKFLVPGNFGNPKQYFNFCLRVEMQEPYIKHIYWHVLLHTCQDIDKCALQLNDACLLHSIHFHQAPWVSRCSCWFFHVFVAHCIVRCRYCVAPSPGAEDAIPMPGHRQANVLFNWMMHVVAFHSFSSASSLSFLLILLILSYVCCSLHTVKRFGNKSSLIWLCGFKYTPPSMVRGGAYQW